MVDLTDRRDRSYMRSTVAASRNASARSWEWFEKIGEVHYAITRSARIAGYARLKCVKYGPDGQIEEEVDSGVPAEIVQSIFSPFGGTRALLDRFYTLQKVPGDSWLLEVVDDNGDLEGYHFASPDELDVASFASWRPGAGELKWITVPATTSGGGEDRFVRPVSPDNLLGRVWTPSRRFVDLSDSALRALDTECEVLHMLTKTLKAKLKSRFAMAGILFLPNEVSTARVRKGTAGGQQVDDVITYLIASMTANVKNFDDASAWMPILLRGPGDSGAKIREIIMDREIFETDLNLRRELIDRILQGLDSNQDATKGGRSQSHWSAWQASDEERRLAVGPDLEMACWAMTRLILHRKLTESGMDPAQVVRYGVHYDLARASVRANQQEDARQLHDRGLISDLAAMRLSGVDEDAVINPEEKIRWVGRQVKNPVLMLHGVDGADDIDWDAAAKFPGTRGPASDSPADDSEAGPGEGDPGSPDDRETDVPRTQRPA